jgi:hypothetical protein
MAIETDDEDRKKKRSKAASAAMKGKLRQSPGPKKVQRPATPKTYTPADMSKGIPLDWDRMQGEADRLSWSPRGVTRGDVPPIPLTGVELFKQHFARNQELGLADGRGGMHTDEMQLPDGRGEGPGLPMARTTLSTLPMMQRTSRPAPQAQRQAPPPAPPAAQAARPRPAAQAAPAAPQAAPAPGGRPRMVQMGEEQAPAAPAAPAGRPDMSVRARAGRASDIEAQLMQQRVDELVQQGFRPEDAVGMVNPEEVKAQAHRKLVSNEVEQGIQSARAEHSAAQMAARNAPRQQTQEELDDDRMARDWRDFQTRGRGVGFQNEREANETSNQGALAALDARAAADDGRFDERVARSVARDRADKKARDADAAARKAADPVQFAKDEADKKARLQGGLERRRNVSSVNDITRRYGEQWLAKNGYDALELERIAALGPQAIGKLRSDLLNLTMGNSAQHINARNSQLARQRARMEGRNPEVFADSLVAAGNDLDRQAQAFAAAGFPDLAQNIIVNKVAQQALRPEAPPDMRTDIDRLYGPNGVLAYIRNNIHPAYQDSAAHSALNAAGVPADQHQDAIDAMKGPQPNVLYETIKSGIQGIGQGIGNFFNGKPVAPQPPAAPANNAVGAATGYLDPQSVARGMRGPSVLRGLA